MREFFSAFHWEPQVSFSRFHGLFSPFHVQPLEFSQHSTAPVKNTKAMQAMCFFSPFHSPIYGCAFSFSQYSTPLPFPAACRVLFWRQKQIFAFKMMQTSVTRPLLGSGMVRKTPPWNVETIWEWNREKKRREFLTFSSNVAVSVKVAPVADTFLSNGSGIVRKNVG
jgi:hypothetical protein